MRGAIKFSGQPIKIHTSISDAPEGILVARALVPTGTYFYIFETDRSLKFPLWLATLIGNSLLKSASRVADSKVRRRTAPSKEEQLSARALTLQIPPLPTTGPLNERPRCKRLGGTDNHPESAFTALVTGATVPVYTITQSQGTALESFLAAHANSAAAVIPDTTIRLPTQPDVLADFSLLGPAGFDSIKPDIQGPGVNIIASVANDGTADGPNLVALYNGTSMATPHTAGSGRC